MYIIVHYRPNGLYQLCTIVHYRPNGLYQSARRNKRRVGGAVLQSLQNSTPVTMMHITVYCHQSARRNTRGGMLCYAHHRVLLIIINQRGADCAVGQAGFRDCAVLRISPCTIINYFNSQRGVAGSAGETQEAGGVLCYNIQYTILPIYRRVY
jgi:hypothetical protein